MKKLPILITVLALGALSAGAATALRVVLASGAESTYVLDHRPVVTYPGSDMVVAAQGASATFARADVVRMDFTDVPVASVEEVIGTTPSAIAYVGGTIHASGDRIDVFDTTGRLRASGSGSLSLSGLENGVYIVVAGTNTLKIVK